MPMIVHQHLNLSLGFALQKLPCRDLGISLAKSHTLPSMGGGNHSLPLVPQAFWGHVGMEDSVGLQAPEVVGATVVEYP